VFIFADRVVETGYDDAILGMAVLRVSGNVEIFGLTALGIERDFLLPAPFHGEWLDDLDNGDAGEGFFLECEWRLEYL
jgi:hypothetical protein